jgi:hypothetical protein
MPAFLLPPRWVRVKLRVGGQPAPEDLRRPATPSGAGPEAVHVVIHLQ